MYTSLGKHWTQAHLSSSRQEARQLVLQFFKQTMLAVPMVIEMYGIANAPVEQVRGHIKTLFRKNKNVRDTAAIDILRFKGQEELEEFLHKFKTNYHVYDRLGLTPPMERTQSSSFLDDFFHGSRNTK